MALPRPATRRRHTLGAAVRALAALLALVALLGGLPWLLWQASTALLPGGLDGLAHLFTRTDTSSVALLFIAAVGWMGWLSFAVSLLVEIPAQLRGRSAPRLPGLGFSQRAAATLVGGILVLLPTGTALAAPATAQAVTTATQFPGQAPLETSAHSTRSAASTTPAAAEAPTAQHTYTVHETRPAESLWSIAEHLTGHGELYTKIAAANEGHTMTDGTVFHTNAPIQPGWILQLPTDLPLINPAPGHTPAPSPSGTPTATPHQVTVRPGDSLWTIAHRAYGDGTHYQDIFQANKGKPQPTGGRLTNPDQLDIGWHLTIPPPHTPTPPQPPATDHPTPPFKPPAPSSPHDTPQPPTPTAPPPTPTPTPSQPDPSISAPATPSPSHPHTPPPAPPATDHVEQSGHGIQLTTVAGAFALLAAAVTSALTLRRILQRRRRAPGETIAIAEDTSPAAAQLAEAAAPTLVDELDLALRTLAHHAQTDQRPLPVVRAARLTQQTLQLLPAEDNTEPQAPFVKGEGGWWALPSTATLLNAEEAAAVPAPCPALTTIGATEDGSVVLLNLAHTRVLLLDGVVEHNREVCTSIALELGMSPWAEHLEIVTLGFGDELPQLLPTTRIAHKREPAHAIHDLADWMLTTHQQPHTTDQPYLLLCATELDHDTAWQLAEALDKAGDLPVILVAPAAPIGRHFPDAPVLNASSSAFQDLEEIGLAVRLQRLAEPAFQQIAAELRTSAQPPHPAQGPWQNTPSEPQHGDHSTEPSPAADHDANAEDEPENDPNVKAKPEGQGHGMHAAGASAGLGAFPALITATTSPSALPLTPTPTPTPSSRTRGASAPPDPEPSTPGPSLMKPVQDKGDQDADDPDVPQIRVLGPVHVPGVAGSGHGPRIAQLAALLYFKPGRTADTLCADMDPLNPWSKKTLDSRLGDLRRCLGDDPHGNPYVPRRTTRDDPYHLSPHISCDWTTFHHRAEHALTHGPTAIDDLERALALVRGTPFGTNPPPWALPHQQEMITKIIDVAHTIITWRTASGPLHDLTAARQAVATALDVDPTAEIIYRAWLRVEQAAGNRPGLFTAATRIQHISRESHCPLDPETEHLIESLLGADQHARGE
ncbi:LysM peptidoglycan-binding domain-containing protein [Streptomyces sp. SDr-06]|uniref:LysM peptidoglycan-binding domain-containing protein n=1 Tax=Streptomyces sp. SDr-06 TaxID=2267702 RepID=UPI000DE89074|nr:LysM peptidoglycan-binding domain-containing protein [Streptomyces sp. SDr-06]RCH59644.1 LysM peptidoglycan-binding domain-containing protein [Streptomyces sp. SDr-06]